jgi:hypothetical protein
MVVEATGNVPILFLWSQARSSGLLFIGNLGLRLKIALSAALPAGESGDRAAGHPKVAAELKQYPVLIGCS